MTHYCNASVELAPTVKSLDDARGAGPSDSARPIPALRSSELARREHRTLRIRASPTPHRRQSGPPESRRTRAPSPTDGAASDRPRGSASTAARSPAGAGTQRPAAMSGATMKSGSNVIPMPSHRERAQHLPVVRMHRTAHANVMLVARLGSRSATGCVPASTRRSGTRAARGPPASRGAPGARCTPATRSRRAASRRCAAPTRLWLPIAPMRTARSNPSSTRSTTRSESSMSKRTCGWRRGERGDRRREVALAERDRAGELQRAARDDRLPT